MGTAKKFFLGIVISLDTFVNLVGETIMGVDSYKNRLYQNFEEPIFCFKRR